MIKKKKLNEKKQLLYLIEKNKAYLEQQKVCKAFLRKEKKTLKRQRKIGGTRWTKGAN